MRILPSLSCLTLAATLIPVAASAQDDEAKIAEARAAAPPEISMDATILDWPSEPGGEFRVLVEGSNGWTCLPDPPGDSSSEPGCHDAAWMTWLKAFMAGETPKIDRIGLSYMLNAEWAVSNTDPAATGPAPGNHWHEGGSHLMMIVPDPAMLEAFPTEPSPHGQPYVMWKGTPYAHVMIPVPEAHGGGH